MSHHIVEAQDLHYVYPDGTPGIRGICFLMGARFISK